MTKQPQRLLRLSAVFLCACLLISACSPHIFAGGGAEGSTPPGHTAGTLNEDAAPSVEPDDGRLVSAWLQALVGRAYETLTFTLYFYEADENYVYTNPDALFKFFGYNAFYDAFTWVALCLPDIIRCKFNYDGRDWLLEFWKGGYAVCLCTGGEIGLYNKPEGQAAQHYFAAEEADWIGMEMSIYNEGVKLFTRPFAATWWVTGFEVLNYLDGFAQGPRRDCTMEARLELKDEEMAAKVAQCLEEKGFVRAASPLQSGGPTECYTLSGSTICVLWCDYTEGPY
ncbi:MAG: DUF4474 domain-containing protein [Oscillospiraceae bacterium]|nr:DUF4474 domain-containing protein [Oscillospiraceae bacterium]